MKRVTSIKVSELKTMAGKMYGGLVKGVVDVKKRILVLDAEMHADEEQFLLEKGSNQEDLWGINLFPEKYGSDDFVEFDSMINIRPRQKNMSREVENQRIRRDIIRIVDGIVKQ